MTEAKYHKLIIDMLEEEFDAEYKKRSEPYSKPMMADDINWLDGFEAAMDLVGNWKTEIENA